MQAPGQGQQLPLVLDHPRHGTVKAVGPAEPGPATAVISAVRVAVMDDAAELVSGQYVPDGCRANPTDLPDTERSEDRGDWEWVRRDRPTQNIGRCFT